MNTNQNLFQSVKYQTIQFTFPLERSDSKEISAIIMRLKEKMELISSSMLIRYSFLAKNLSFNDLVNLLLHKFSSISSSDISLINFDTAFTNYSLLALEPLLFRSHGTISFAGNKIIQSFQFEGEAGKRIPASKAKFSSLLALQNTNGLSHLQELSLILCDSLTDVSSLSKLRKVLIFSCSILTNLTGLGTVYDLELSNCKGIQDISPLTKNHTLKIFSCPNIKAGLLSIMNVEEWKTDLFTSSSFLGEEGIFPQLSRLTVHRYLEKEFPYLRNLKHLSLTCFLIDLSYMNCQNFSHLTSLSISCTPNLQAISVLRDIPVLKLNSISRLQDISSLGGKNKSVTISYCSLIKDFSSLKNVPKVTILSCGLFSNANDVSDVEELTITDLFQVSDISCLGKVKKLTATPSSRH